MFAHARTYTRPAARSLLSTPSLTSWFLFSFLFLFLNRRSLSPWAHAHAQAHTRPAWQLAVGGERVHVHVSEDPGLRAARKSRAQGPGASSGRFSHAEADGCTSRSLIVSAGRKFPPAPPASVGAAAAAAGCRTLPPASCISGISCPCTPKAPSMASSAPWGESAVPAPRHSTSAGARTHARTPRRTCWSRVSAPKRLRCAKLLLKWTLVAQRHLGSAAKSHEVEQTVTLRRSGNTKAAILVDNDTA